MARRARLEDDVAALGFVDQLDLDDLFDEGNREALRRVEWALEALKRSASGKLALEKEMRELDNKLGLTPEAMAKLRWAIFDDAGEQKPMGPRPSSSVPRRADLRVVDPSLAESG